jgi:DNA-binding CsgD family transcriptional regulator
VDSPPDLGLDAPSGPRVNASAARLALIERDEEWKRASQAIGLARGDEGSVLLFEGASGLGKSGLLGAIRALAEGSGAQVLVAAGHRHESQFRFGLAMQLLESAASVEVTSLIAPDLLEATAQEALFSQIHGLYRACAGLAAVAGPVVLLVDDADLADEESLRFLLYLTERISQLGIAVVLTAGTVPSRRAPRLLAEIARHPSTRYSRLQPLSAAGTERRVAKTSLSAAAQGAADEIHRASGGNPLIVDALADALGQAEDRNGGAAPAAKAAGLASPGVAEWALVRAAQIDDDGPRLVRAIALLGEGCEVRHACALAELDLETAGELLDVLAEVGILAPGERLGLAQPALGAAIEYAQTPSERAASNLRAARILADDGEPPERVAELLLRATRMGSAATVETLSLAASVSLGRGDPFAAVRYLRRALEEPPSREHRAGIVLDLGRVEAMAGEPQAALRLADGLAQLSVGAHRPSKALITGRTLFALGRPFEALVAFERGLDGVDAIDTDLAARLAAARDTATWLTSKLKGEASELPPLPDSADTAGKRTVLALHAFEGAARGTPAAEVRELATRSLAGGALLDDETSDGLAYYLATTALTFAGDLHMAEAALTAAVEEAGSRGSILGFATAAHLRARTIRRRGRLGDAALDARRAVAVERDGWRFGLGGARVVLADLLIERGALGRAERQLDLADAARVETDPFQFSLLSVRGRLMLYSGDAEGALESFMACGAIADRTGVTNPAMIPWRADAGLATAVIGDWAEGERLVESELSLARQFGEPGAIGRALLALGSVREGELALEVFEEAVETLGSSQAALDRATALVEFGAALRRCGRRRDARAPLREGLELAERCGAQVLAARALREANVAGARPRRTALHGAEALTTRERQVATLAAEGLSNRQIAEHLVVTVKTVEWHLKNSYLKLGVRSRKELGGALGSGDAS